MEVRKYDHVAWPMRCFSAPMAAAPASSSPCLVPVEEPRFFDPILEFSAHLIPWFVYHRQYIHQQSKIRFKIYRNDNNQHSININQHSKSSQLTTHQWTSTIMQSKSTGTGCHRHASGTPKVELIRWCKFTITWRRPSMVYPVTVPYQPHVGIITIMGQLTNGYN